MKCGIVGLPNVGKSTIFNCLSSTKVKAENFPFCTIEPNILYVNVPDSRLVKLKELINPKIVIPAKVEILDIAGIVKGAYKGEGLGNKFLDNIRNTNAIIHVLRCFENPNIIHVEGNVNPLRDKNIIDTELQLKDLEIITKYLKKYKKITKSGDKQKIKILFFIERIFQILNNGKNLRNFSFSIEEHEYINKMQLLTYKPVIYLCNVDEKNLKYENIYINKIKSIAISEKSEILLFAAKNEFDITELSNNEEKIMFLKDLGLQTSGINTLIKKIYNILNLQTYFTIGNKEVHAWTIKKGWTAYQAASVIHSDFQKGFIKANVIHYKDFINAGSESKSRNIGYMTLEGKEYIVHDGDIIHFRFNI